MAEPEDEKEPKPFPWIVTTAVAIGTLALIYAGWHFARPSTGEYASLGDVLAPLTAVATAFGLIGALVSVDIQRRELFLQRREMKESRAELARTAEAQEALVEASRAQVEALEAAARMANAQRALLEESAKAARLQAVAAAWQPIGTFLTDANDALETMTKWHNLAITSRAVAAVSINAIADLRIPVVPLFLPLHQLDAAERIVRKLTIARGTLRHAFNESIGRNPPAPFKGSDEVGDCLKVAEALLTGLRQGVAQSLGWDGLAR